MEHGTPTIRRIGVIEFNEIFVGQFPFGVVGGFDMTFDGFKFIVT